MLRGSCLCGGIRYEVTGPLRTPLNCHCSMCRKATGAAFRTRAAIAESDFHWVAGENLLGRYRSSEFETRTFCSVCGSTLVTLIPRRKEVGLALGTLDDDPGIRIERNIFVGSKAPWYEICDDLPQDD